MQETPRAWIGCLACYNNGDLVGDWVDADEAEDFVPCDIPGHEEWWVFDHEYLPISGECSPYEAQEGGKQVTAIAEHLGLTIGQAAIITREWVDDGNDLERLEENFEGLWASEKNYAQNYYEDNQEIRSEWPYDCIDWEWATNQLFMDYTSIRVDGQVAVFSRY